MNRIETLESRRLLSATLNARGVLRVVGETDSANTISVTLNNAGDHVIVTENGAQTGSFKLSDVRAVIVHGGDQNDTLSVASNVTVRSVLIGHGGDDNLTGGGGGNVLEGGAGNDTLLARGTRTLIVGEAGGDNADSIASGVGDQIHQGENAAIQFVIDLLGRLI